MVSFYLLQMFFSSFLLVVEEFIEKSITYKDRGRDLQLFLFNCFINLACAKTPVNSRRPNFVCSMSLKLNPYLLPHCYVVLLLLQLFSLLLAYLRPKYSLHILFVLCNTDEHVPCLMWLSRFTRIYSRET